MKKQMWLIVASLTVLMPLGAVQAKENQEVPAGETAVTSQIEIPKFQEPLMVKVDGTEVLVPEGIKVPLEIQTFLVGNKARIGQEVRYLVSEDVFGPNKEILITKGTPAIGKVTDREGGKTFGRSGLLAFSADYTTAVDGAPLPLIFSYTVKPNNQWWRNLLALGAKGKKAKVRPGTKFEAVIGIAPPVAVTTGEATTDKPATGEPPASPK